MKLNDPHLDQLQTKYEKALRDDDKESTAVTRSIVTETRHARDDYKQKLVDAENAKADNATRPATSNTKLPYWKTEKGKAAAARYRARKKKEAQK